VEVAVVLVVDDIGGTEESVSEMGQLWANNVSKWGETMLLDDSGNMEILDSHVYGVLRILGDSVTLWDDGCFLDREGMWGRGKHIPSLGATPITQ
jgi:hypothetical protein